MLSFVFVLKNADGAHLRTEPGQFFLDDLFSKSQIYQKVVQMTSLTVLLLFMQTAAILNCEVGVGGASPTFWLELWPEGSEFSRALQVYALKNYLHLI